MVLFYDQSQQQNNQIEEMSQIQLDGIRYVLDRKIGEGYTSEVYRAMSNCGKKVCVKVINDAFYKTPTGKDLIDNQIAILSQLSHPHILQFHKKEYKEKLFIVTQYCAEGNLYEYLHKKREIEEAEVFAIIKQLVQACLYMHEKDILHRDLKPQNIFLNGKNFKIADFGFASALSNTKLMKVNVGSPLYMPLQSLNQMIFSPKSDVFAIGVIWYELLTGKTPFEAKSQQELKEKLSSNGFRNITVKCSKKMETAIFKCLSKRMDDRPSMKELVYILENICPLSIKKLRTQSTMEFTKDVKEISKEKKTIKDIKKYFNKENHPPKLSLCENRGNKSKVKENARDLRESKQVSKEFKQKNSLQTCISKRLSLKGSKHSSIVLKCKQEKDQIPQFIELLRKLSKLNLTFLPFSIQLKFLTLVEKYQHLLMALDGQTGLIMIKGSQDVRKDELMVNLSACTTQTQFCKCCLGFLRRLLRLAKSYKQWAGVLEDLNYLWQRVEKKSWIC